MSKEPTTIADTYLCIVCNKPVKGYGPTFCCSGQECACMGRPIEPAVCSVDCWELLFKERKNN